MTALCSSNATAPLSKSTTAQRVVGVGLHHVYFDCADSVIRRPIGVYQFET